MKSYSIVVIGAGSAGLVIAIGCARANKKVLLIERGHWGGDCTNFGCIPSKSLIGAAKQRKEGKIALAKVREIVSKVRAHEEPEALQKLGVDTLTASASFVDPYTLEAKDEKGQIHSIQAKKIVIAAGSRPKTPSVPGILETPFLTNETIFNLELPPKDLIVLGGGPIGCELAQAFQRLGSSVKLVHTHKELLKRDPLEASNTLIETFQEQGMQLYLGHQIEKIQYKSNLFSLTLKNLEEKITAEHLLVATGRESNVQSLSLEKAQIHCTEKGIDVDAYGRTSQKHIFAVGDITGPPFFTHLAENRARAILTTLLLSPFWRKKIDHKQAIPRVTYTDPEIASIGISEEEAIEKYGKTRIATYVVPMSTVDRAITQDHTKGFVKIITKRWSSQILGATIVCSRAGEMLSEISLAMFSKIPLRKLSALIHPYPTYNLAIRRCADEWLTKTILPFLKKS